MPRILLPALCVFALAACTRAAPPTDPSGPAAASASAPATGDASPASAAAPAAVPAPSAPTLTDMTPWQCGDRSIGVRFDPAGAVTLDLDGRLVTLPQARSGSGARYADDQGNEFWNTGRDARLTLAGQSAVDCTEAATASPWEAARARGAAFRALGTEPGWTAELGSGASPSLHADLDYGERRVQVPQMKSDADAFTGTTADGVAVRLQTTRESCSDGMSDATYPASVTLKVGATTYRGCGRFLTE